MSEVPQVLLSLEGVSARYGSIEALHGINLDVKRGQIVALLGANGAGKSTTLRTISGLVPASAGTIRFAGHDIACTPAHKLPHLGLVHVPEGRRVFGSMSILDNLVLGSFTLADAAERRRRLDHVFDLFPVLARRSRSEASFLSGGEQQMLAIGRAMMAAPQMLLLDEPSMGLAPLMLKEVMRIVLRLNQDGVTILLVEQNTKVALGLSHYAYVIETGRISLEGPASDLAHDEAVIKAYLGG